MSDHFTIYCPICDEAGPDIRRSVGGVGFVTDHLHPFGSGNEEWTTFLIEHGFHGPLSLFHEITPKSQYASRSWQGDA